MYIPIEILSKYGIIDTLEERLENVKHIPEKEVKENYFYSFLTATDHVVNKLTEGVITTSDCADVLAYREYARQQIAELRGETYTPKELPTIEQRTTETENTINTMLSFEDKEMAASQMRRTLQLFAETLPDEMALEIPCMYPVYEVDRAYKTDDLISYGLNSKGEPQLYRIVQDHTSQEDWQPDSTPSLYSAIGLNPEGYPVWKRPTGAHDAYNTGDIVDYNGTLYKSLIDGNTWSPDEYPQGWEQFNK